MEVKRLYVKGLPKNITDDELCSRFKSFGSVSDVNLAKDAFEGDCRGFGHLSLACSEGDLRKCLSALNGSSWKGHKILIQEAKPKFEIKKDKEPTEPVSDIKKETKKRKRLERHSSNMTLVDEKNVEGRKGWRRGKFGRAIAIVKLRKPDGSLVVMDPSHDPEALDRFYEGYHPRPTSRLSWFPDQPKNETTYEVSSSESEESEHDEEQVSNAMEVDVQNEATSKDTPAAEVASESVKPFKWDDVVAGQGFSLSLALNLPVAEPVTPKEPTSAIATRTETVKSKPEKQFDFGKLFFDFSPIFSKAINAEELFMCQGSKLESVSVWKAGRSEIRKDFKKQAKAAKRMIRKKQSLHKMKSILP